MSKPKLLAQVRAVMRLQHLSLATEHAYVQWIKRYIIFHKMRHPLEMGAAEIREFLTHLTVKLEVTSSTQNQALYALLFLYGQVLHKDIGPVGQIERAKRSKRLPEVFTPEEARKVIAQLHGTNRLMAGLLYGSGLRLMECLRLRVKDIDFERHQIIVREGKGDKDRVTMLPLSLHELLKELLAKIKLLHEEEIREGFGTVILPYALSRKYSNAEKEWKWQYVFPASRRSIDPRSARKDAIISIHQCCKRPSSARFAMPESVNMRAAIRFDTASQHICWNQVMTSAQFRNCSAIRMCARR